MNRLINTVKQSESRARAAHPDICKSQSHSSDDFDKSEEVKNPYIDETDKKRNKKLVKPEIRMKHFDPENVEEVANESSPTCIPSQGLGDVTSMVPDPAKMYRQRHFDVRETNLNMTTRCSKVDESFVDYLLEEYPKKQKGGIKGLFGSLLMGKESSIQEKKFIIYFDQALYEAPPIVLKLEEDMAES